MPLIIGEDKIKSIYVGDQKIKKAYLGDELVYSVGVEDDDGPVEKVDLPTGYKQVKYIESTKSYFDIGVKPTTSTIIQVDVTPILPIEKDKYILWSVYAASDKVYRYGLYLYKNGYIGYFGSGNYYENNVANYDETKRINATISCPKKTVTINEEPAKTIRSEAFSFSTSMNTIHLLSASATRDGLHAKLYSCTVSGNANRNFIPCINPSGVAGLYDIANNQFYTPVGDPVVAGPEV